MPLNDHPILNVRESLELPLEFPKKMLEYCEKFQKDINPAMVNSSDLDLMVDCLTQIVKDLSKFCLYNIIIQLTVIPFHFTKTKQKHKKTQT